MRSSGWRRNEEDAAGERLGGFIDGSVVATGLGPEEVAPFLVYALFEQGMAHLTHRLLFHAAVVAKDGRALLLPAASGSGKSTLAAALAVSGWTYLSDELAVIDPRTLRVESFPLPVGLKDKSMAPLRPLIPNVAALPRHVRADGTGVRYFRPPRVATEAGLPVAALVFPRFRPKADAQCTPLPPLEALRRLAATGSSARALGRDDIQAMLKLAQRPSFSLGFGDLGTAVEALENLAKGSC